MNRPQREALNIVGLGSVLTVPVVSYQFRAHPEVQVKEASPDPQPGLCWQAEPGSSGGVSQVEITTKKYSFTDSFPGKPGSGEAAPGAGPGRGSHLRRHRPTPARSRAAPAAGSGAGGLSPGGGKGGEVGREGRAGPRGWPREDPGSSLAAALPRCRALSQRSPPGRRLRACERAKQTSLRRGV